jgi:hypothetical protein
MVEARWLKILESRGTVTLGVRFLVEMEPWVIQVSFILTGIPSCCMM